jgi:hypothetical protein
MKLTTRYFEILGAEHRGSVVPQCQANRPLQPHPTKLINYTSAVEDLRHCLRLVNVDPSGYSEHSMKRGGATEAAKRGATVGEIQHAGHWTCSLTAEKYIDESQRRIKDFNKYFI